MNDISTWDSNLLAQPSKTVETNSWVIGQIIDVTNIEYIDYESQKLYSTNNTSTNISLPSISTVAGKNKLRIPPDKKPSKLMIKYLT